MKVSEQTRHEGSCLCGRVRYMVEGPVGNMSSCHCTDCRKNSGAAFVTYVEARKPAFKYVKGGAEITTHTTDEKKTKRDFCRHCGSTLLCYIADDDLIEITAATLDTPLSLRPEYHIYVRSKVAWHDIQDGKPQYQTTSRPED